MICDPPLLALVMTGRPEAMASMGGRAGVDIGGGVELHDVRRRLVKEHAISESELANLFKKRCAIIPADYQQLERKFMICRHCF